MKYERCALLLVTFAMLSASAQAQDGDTIIQIGQWTCEGTSPADVSCAPVTFASPFGASPTVVLSLSSVPQVPITDNDHAYQLSISATNISPTGFTPRIPISPPASHSSGSELPNGYPGGTLRGSWIAMGPKPAFTWLCRCACCGAPLKDGVCPSSDSFEGYTLGPQCTGNWSHDRASCAQECAPYHSLCPPEEQVSLCVADSNNSR